MATTSSPPARPGDRRAARRRETLAEALDHAEAIIAERGAGGLSVSEVARRMGVRGPSLYKYFPSLHAMYDALFARGLASNDEAVQEAVASAEVGIDTIRAAGTAIVRWSVEHPALAQLLFWRPVPGFEPSPEVFEASAASMEQARAAFADAVRLGQLAPGADSDGAVRLYTVVLSGLLSQQMANEPGAGYETGSFTRLTDQALEMFFAHWNPRGGPDADP